MVMIVVIQVMAASTWPCVCLSVYLSVASAHLLQYSHIYMH